MGEPTSSSGWENPLKADQDEMAITLGFCIVKLGQLGKTQDKGCQF